jgi:hypothetical protein
MNEKKSIIDLSNFLLPYLNNGYYLQIGLTPGCRCLHCEGYHIVSSDGITVCYADNLVDFLSDAYTMMDNIKWYKQKKNEN